ncbi:hypothetical protein T12_4 [Trichinella patagoniensis]|uniref:Uncharacterized protein n=1 Tax=Trichinella patagoniensis TaxID=990121 RepID=A0A0V0Z609_9BILA|nr:hypothetical protein T12_4 [Trichinella patagoniensis]
MCQLQKPFIPHGRGGETDLKNVSTIVKIAYLSTIDDIEEQTPSRFLTHVLHIVYYDDYE